VKDLFQRPAVLAAELQGKTKMSSATASQSVQSRQLFDNDDDDYYEDYYVDDPPPARRRNARRPQQQQQFRKQAVAKRQLNLLTKAKMAANRRSSAAVHASSNSVGSYSGHHKQCDNGIPLALLLTTLLGIGALFYTLYTKVTMAPGRKRRSSQTAWEQVEDGMATIDAEGIYDLVYGGRRLHGWLRSSSCYVSWVKAFVCLSVCLSVLLTFL
jgi:hypothetical protein